MAQYPGNHTATLFGLILGTPSFQPTLEPPRQTIFQSAYSTRPVLQTNGSAAINPWGIAADANDNIWITGMANAGLVELASNGAPLSPSTGGVGNATLQAASTRQVAVDLNGNILTVDSAATPNVYIYNPNTAATTIIAPGGLSLSGIAVDSANNLWYSSTSSTTSGQALGQLAYNSGTHTFATTPTIFSVATPLPGTGTAALTVNAVNNDVWAPSQSSGVTSFFLPPYSNAVAQVTTADSTNYAAAIDKSSNTWITGTSSAVNGSHLFVAAHGNPSGTPLSYNPTVTTGTGSVCGPLKGCGLYGSTSVMIDGNNRLFISSYTAGMIVEFDPLIGTTGSNTGSFLLTAEGNGFNPSNNAGTGGIIATSAARTLAIDASGALWTINGTPTASLPVVQILGVAAPTISVLAQGKYGVKP